MTRGTEMDTTCQEQQSAVVTTGVSGKKKAVTFDDVRPLLLFALFISPVDLY